MCARSSGDAGGPTAFSRTACGARPATVATPGAAGSCATRAPTVCTPAGPRPARRAACGGRTRSPMPPSPTCSGPRPWPCHSGHPAACTRRRATGRPWPTASSQTGVGRRPSPLHTDARPGGPPCNCRTEDGEEDPGPAGRGPAAGVERARDGQGLRARGRLGGGRAHLGPGEDLEREHPGRRRQPAHLLR